MSIELKDLNTQNILESNSASFAKPEDQIPLNIKLGERQALIDLISHKIETEEKKSIIDSIHRRMFELNPLKGITHEETELQKDLSIYIPQFLLTQDGIKADLAKKIDINGINKPQHDKIKHFRDGKYSGSLENISNYSRYFVEQYGNEQYLTYTQNLYEENQETLDSFLRKVIEYKKLNTIDSNLYRPESVFIVHKGTDEEAHEFFGETIKNFNSDEINMLISSSPAFVMFSQNNLWPDGKSTKCVTMCTSSIPKSDRNTEILKEQRASAIEACLYSQLILEAKAIGLGGMLPTATHKGVQAELALDIVKIAVLNGLDKGIISPEEYSEYLEIMNSRINTGHSGTTAAILETLKADSESRNLNPNSNVVLIGGGGIGISVVAGIKDMFQYKELENKTIYVIDKNEQSAKRVVGELQKLGIVSDTKIQINVTTIKDLTELKIEDLANISQVIACTSDAETLFQKPEYVEFNNKLTNAGSNATLIDDQHPHATRTKKDYTAGEITEVGLVLPIEISTIYIPSYGNYFGLGKPANIFYGCHGEALVCGKYAPPSSSFIGDATPESEKEYNRMQQELTNIGNKKVGVQFHYQGQVTEHPHNKKFILN